MGMRLPKQIGGFAKAGESSVDVFGPILVPTGGGKSRGNGSL
jgi:hypothetical protein